MSLLSLVGRCARSPAMWFGIVASPFGALIALASLTSSCVPRERSADRSTSSAPAAPATPAAPSRADVPSQPKAAARARAAEAGSLSELPDPALRAVFQDDFERAELGPDWRATSPAWTLAQGRLCGQNARNHPIWLKRRLPTNARIEFDATTSSTDGDIKAEFWGDGRSAASGQSYTDATSYLTIFGGWQNRFHVLARIDEHAPDRREIKLTPGEADFIKSTVVPDRAYRFQVERRDGRTVSWRVNEVEILTYDDSRPLLGTGHEHFGFNDWQVRVCFDNLRVTPLQN
jgi:hypothetical protein